MKKILSIMFAFLLIFSCFAVTAFAEDVAIEVPDYDYWGAIYYETQPVMTLSEDYKKLYVDGESFSRFNASMLVTDFAYSVDVVEKHNPYSHTGAYVDLTDEQRNNIVNINIEVNPIKNMYRIAIYFNDGSVLSMTFLQDSYFEEYNEIVSGKANEYKIDFKYPDENIVTAQKAQLFGEIGTLSRNELSKLYDYYYVTAENSDGSIAMYSGQLLSVNETFYYVDFQEAGLDGANWYDDIALGNLADYPVHKITDEALLKNLQSAQQKYYEDDYGVLYDDSATDAISAVFLIFIFAVVPAVIFVIFLVKAIRGKGVYKKIYGTVTALCAAELIVFIIIAVIITSVAPSSDLTLRGSDGNEYIVLDTDFTNEEVVMLKEAVYCGDGNCTDGCTTGFFYHDQGCSEEYAMGKLGLGEPDGVSDEHFGNKNLYKTSFEENIVVETTEYENGYIVEYQVIGVG